MRHTIEFDHENRWVLTSFHGPLRIEDAVALLRQSVLFPGWTPEWDRIIDYSDGLLGDLEESRPAGVEGCNSAGKIRVTDLAEAGVAQFGGKALLVGETSDGFDQVLIAGAVLGDMLPEFRHYIE